MKLENDMKLKKDIKLKKQLKFSITSYFFSLIAICSFLLVLSACNQIEQAWDDDYQRQMDNAVVDQVVRFHSELPESTFLEMYLVYKPVDPKCYTSDFIHDTIFGGNPIVDFEFKWADVLNRGCNEFEFSWMYISLYGYHAGGWGGRQWRIGRNPVNPLLDTMKFIFGDPNRSAFGFFDEDIEGYVELYLPPEPDTIHVYLDAEILSMDLCAWQKATGGDNYAIREKCPQNFE